MDRRMRLGALVAACVTTLTFCAVAYAGYTDMNDFNLTESTSTYGGGTQFHISSTGNGNAYYRWLDSPTKTTVISANYCNDWALINSNTHGVGDTTYKWLFGASQGFCFVMRGRTAAGQGSMTNYDGRVDR